jgi:cholesterol transport system auxiliary component
MMRRGLVGGLIATALATTLGGSGCSVLPTQAYLQRREWPLVVRRPDGVPMGMAADAPAEMAATRPGRPGRRVLLVRTIQPGPGLDARGLQTLQPDGSLRTEFYEQWAVPPAQGMDDDLRRWLADSGLFAAVVATGSRMTADLVLEGQLVALQANLGDGTARATLSFVLIDPLPASARILLERTETASVKLAGTDPPALARAQLAAVAEVLRQTEADLAIALHK